MQKRERLYEGKAKILFSTEDPEILWVEYKDDATAFNGAKKGSIADKGRYNNEISSVLFQYLERNGLPNHFVEQPSERVMLVKNLRMFPLEAVVRNVVAGSLAKRMGLAEGTVLTEPVIEMYLKNDELGDPLLNESHIRALGIATPAELRQIEELSVRTNQLLLRYLEPRGLRLIDFKLEFGYAGDRILLGDEISPDTCRFWDQATGERLDKDRFRRDLGGVVDAYQEVWRRVKNDVPS